MKMNVIIETGYRSVKVDLARPLPISIRMRHGKENPVAWYAPYPIIEPFSMDGFIGSVAQGGSVNTNNIFFNPHGNGTHTECIGHLTEEVHQIDEYMHQFIFMAQLHSVEPVTLQEDESEYRKSGDRVIKAEAFKSIEFKKDVKAMIIRTRPNDKSKITRTYTGNNPPYVDPEAMVILREHGIEHVLIDLPSVDRENDGGRMLAHRAFWFHGDQKQMHNTITEMIYVPDTIADGDYLLNIMIAAFGNDASPSKPVLYPLLA